MNYRRVNPQKLASVTIAFFFWSFLGSIWPSDRGNRPVGAATSNSIEQWYYQLYFE